MSWSLGAVTGRTSSARGQAPWRAGPIQRRSSSTRRRSCCRGGSSSAKAAPIRSDQGGRARHDVPGCSAELPRREEDWNEKRGLRTRSSPAVEEGAGDEHQGELVKPELHPARFQPCRRRAGREGRPLRGPTRDRYRLLARRRRPSRPDGGSDAQPESRDGRRRRRLGRHRPQDDLYDAADRVRDDHPGDRRGHRRGRAPVARSSDHGLQSPASHETCHGGRLLTSSSPRSSSEAAHCLACAALLSRAAEFGVSSGTMVGGAIRR